MNEAVALVGGSSPLVLPAVIAYGRRLYQLVATPRHGLMLRAYVPESQLTLDIDSKTSV